MQINYSNSNQNEIRLELCKIIMKKINENGWTQTIAAEKLGIDIPKISQMKKQMESKEMHGFSLNRLLGFYKTLVMKLI